MRYELRLPEIGDGISEAFVSEWLAPIGSRVSVGEEIVEVVTDKANLAIESYVAGTLVEQCVGEEERVIVGQVLGIIETATDGAS